MIQGMPDDPHADQPVIWRGLDPSAARLVVVLVHGRGASAEAIFTLADQFEVGDVAYVAPEAADHTWYPYSFLAPMEQNEPKLSSALHLLEGVMDDVMRRGIPSNRIALVGFSQGACLTLEFAARHAQRYAAIAGLSGGLIGPPGTPRDYAGTLAQTPLFLGCSDVDAHVPVERVHESATVFKRLGAAVDERIYPGMGHTVNRDELDAVRALLGAPR
jgi:predicted esterase